ncbi:thiolase family protein [Amycolatopsis sp. GM8]|uniref:thiolase family protein n=1 Tax=Amycolatopsis sp. GM8 TaxID=2896530 RepID=UPI001F33A062|nr:thiolase family protein [Amycolatopsis sp. GM8]
MSAPVIVSAARTAIGTTGKGTLADTSGETLAAAIVEETVRRSGLEPAKFDDVILAESLYGGGDLARHAAVATGMPSVSGVAVNRHCAGSLTSIGMAAASIGSGMESAIVAGGVQATSMGPRLRQRVPGTTDEYVDWFPPTHPDSPEAPNRDMSISVGWNTAKEAGITREEQDAWAYRSHVRAIEAIDAGKFTDEIVPLKLTKPGGAVVEFAVDEHPRRTTTLEKLASLKVLHPEIPGFSITAGNASGINDAAAAVAVAGAEFAAAEGLTPLAKIIAWGAAGVEPARMGFGGLDAAEKVLARAGRTAADVTLWEINEAFASVPIAVCRALGLDEERVNFSGSGCSLGHPVAASGARMIVTLVHELRRRGGGLGMAAMCAGGGQGGAVLIEV